MTLHCSQKQTQSKVNNRQKYCTQFCDGQLGNSHPEIFPSHSQTHLIWLPYAGNYTDIYTHTHGHTDNIYITSLQIVYIIYKETIATVGSIPQPSQPRTTNIAITGDTTYIGRTLVNSIQFHSGIHSRVSRHIKWVSSSLQIHNADKETYALHTAGTNSRFRLD